MAVPVKFPDGRLRLYMCHGTSWDLMSYTMADNDWPREHQLLTFRGTICGSYDKLPQATYEDPLHLFWNPGDTAVKVQRLVDHKKIDEPRAIRTFRHYHAIKATIQHEYRLRVHNLYEEECGHMYPLNPWIPPPNDHRTIYFSAIDDDVKQEPMSTKETNESGQVQVQVHAISDDGTVQRSAAIQIDRKTAPSDFLQASFAVLKSKSATKGGQETAKLTSVAPLEAWSVPQKCLWHHTTAIRAEDKQLPDSLFRDSHVYWLVP